MGYEITYSFHERKEEGVGYNTDVVLEKTSKVGKPFEDTPLEKAAAAIMGQFARRDILIIDVKIDELVRKPVSFKECKDGRGIILRNKKFSFNDAAQMVAEDVIEIGAPLTPSNSGQVQAAMPMVIPEGMQPHEVMALQRQQTTALQPVQQNLDDLYNPNKPVPVRHTPIQVDQKRRLYTVIFDPELPHQEEAKRLGLKFTVEKSYPVHQVVPHPMGKMELQKIIVTDDTGKAVKVDEKFFTTAGAGLLGDRELGFSKSPNGNGRKPKLMYEDQMRTGGGGRMVDGIPVDDGSIPAELMAVPDLRPGRR